MIKRIFKRWLQGLWITLVVLGIGAVIFGAMSGIAWVGFKYGPWQAILLGILLLSIVVAFFEEEW